DEFLSWSRYRNRQKGKEPGRRDECQRYLHEHVGHSQYDYSMAGGHRSISLFCWSNGTAYPLFCGIAFNAGQCLFSMPVWRQTFSDFAFPLQRIAYRLSTWSLDSDRLSFNGGRTADCVQLALNYYSSPAPRSPAMSNELTNLICEDGEPISELG